MVSRISTACALYLLAGSLFSLIVAFYRLQGRWATLYAPGWTWVSVIVPVSTFVLACAALIVHYRHSRRTEVKDFRLVLSMGVVALALCFLGGEVLIRALAEETPEGPILGNTVLLPRDWARVLAHRRAHWAQASRDYGVFTSDETLGWTVGRNRKGIGPYGETYFSNEDGLRTRQNGVSVRDQSATLRIAILGDSYTFGEDVSFEDSWGHQLEVLIGSGVQVLNFGVPAYGIDQAYLRYVREVREWHPDIVILSFISHDLVRSGMVYYWIGFPGAAVPGAKPRFSLVGEQLTVLNFPLPSPEQIHSTSIIGDLPFIQFDSAYHPTDWEWHLYQYSYLLRFAISWQFDTGSASYELNKEDQKINEAILHSFVRTAKSAGSDPMVVFFPEYTELRNSSGMRSEPNLLGRRLASEAGVEFVDLTSCLETVAEGARFTAGWHYTPQANSAVAHCLQSRLLETNALRQLRKSVPR